MMDPAQSAEITIEDINSAISDGGEQYWYRIYQAYFTPLQRFIAYELGQIPADIAEELSCKTLMKLVLIQTKPRFAVKRQFIAWLYKAARSTALDYWKCASSKGRRNTQVIDDEKEFCIDLPASYDVEKPTDQAVEDVLNHLSKSDRMLLMMRANGTPYSIIAKELGIEENAARSCFTRAKKRFRKLYLECSGKSAP